MRFHLRYNLSIWVNGSRFWSLFIRPWFKSNSRHSGSIITMSLTEGLSPECSVCSPAFGPKMIHLVLLLTLLYAFTFIFYVVSSIENRHHKNSYQKFGIIISKLILKVEKHEVYYSRFRFFALGKHKTQNNYLHVRHFHCIMCHVICEIHLNNIG